MCGPGISARWALCGPKMQSNKNSRCFQLEGRTCADLPRWKSQHMHDCANFNAGYLAVVWAVRCVACDPLFFIVDFCVRNEMVI